MEVNIKPGKYIVAVSGGVDSMVLLDLLSKKPELDLIVAHFDHGIRQDSDQDAVLVKRVAEKLQLKFELKRGNLGSAASEETARDARYKFFQGLKRKYQADGIITAHQKDDVIETAIINIIRGTGPRGLSALTSSKTITRPLLHVTKAEIKKYALANKIPWREDSTNEDTKYLRNYVRKNVVTKLNDSQKELIISNIDKAAKLQIKKNVSIAKLSGMVKKDTEIDRQSFSLLPREVGSELVAAWMRDFGYRDFDKKTVERVNIIIRTALPNTKHDIGKNIEIEVDKFSARFK